MRREKVMFFLFTSSLKKNAIVSTPHTVYFLVSIDTKVLFSVSPPSPIFFFFGFIYLFIFDFFFFFWIFVTFCFVTQCWFYSMLVHHHQNKRKCDYVVTAQCVAITCTWNCNIMYVVHHNEKLGHIYLLLFSPEILLKYNGA